MTDFAPIVGSAPELAAALDDLGLVVETVIEVGRGLEDVVVARVEEIGAITGADRIRRVVVEAGDGPVEVVCGAWNFSVGDLVPLAPVGTVLPGGFEIGRRKMKGVVSNGMLCSARELELAEDHEGILVLGQGPAAGAEPGMGLMAALGIERDVVFDLAVEANRPDAWSVAGVTRDLAARLKVPFALPVPSPPATTATPASSAGASGAPATVQVFDPDLCPRFTAQVVAGVEVGDSPRWVARRLTLAGMRPINNVVDASNYVMLELGQPTHPYDLDRLPGHGLLVRAARPGETIVTLDGVERRLGERTVGGGDDRRDCLICDAEDTPVGIGGVMGGGSSEISRATTRVMVEAAYFAPMAVARTSKRLGLRTEASARFERGCDPEGIDRATERLLEVLALSAGPDMALSGGVLDVSGDVPAERHLPVRLSRVNAVLGTDLDAATVVGLLEPIGFRCQAGSDDVVSVTVPTFRPDTEREIDVVEEVARHYGYSRIARRRPHPPQVGALTGYQSRRRLVRQAAAGLGAHEAWTTSLLAPGDHERAGLPGGIVVANPLSPDDAVLRRSLLPGLLRAVAFNADRRQWDVRLFEIGHVFPPPDEARLERAAAHQGDTVVDEREMLAVAFAGVADDARTAAGAWMVLRDALGLADVEMSTGLTGATALHPTRRAELRLGGGAVVGEVGEVDPDVMRAFGLDPDRRRVGWLEVDLTAVLGAGSPEAARAAPVSRFPSSDIDLALVVGEEVWAAEVAATLAAAGGDLLESVRLFDVYRGAGVPDGTRSLAYRLRFCALDRTLTDEEVGALRLACIEAVALAHQAALRA